MYRWLLPLTNVQDPPSVDTSTFVADHKGAQKKLLMQTQVIFAHLMDGKFQYFVPRGFWRDLQWDMEDVDKGRGRGGRGGEEKEEEEEIVAINKIQRYYYSVHTWNVSTPLKFHSDIHTGSCLLFSNFNRFYMCRHWWPVTCTCMYMDEKKKGIWDTSGERERENWEKWRELEWNKGIATSCVSRSVTSSPTALVYDQHPPLPLFSNCYRLWGEKVNVLEPHDPFDFFNCLVDSLDEGLKAYGCNPVLSQILGGAFAYQKICKSCLHR